MGLVGARSFDFVLRFSNSLYVMAGIASLLWVLAALVAPGIVRAQVAGGSIVGAARGESGAAVPGVQLTLKDETTGEVRTVSTSSDGLYSIPALPPGSYEMTVSAPGFVTQVWTGITVAVGTERVLNIVMRAGSPEVVMRAATSAPALGQTSSGGSVDASVVRDTPLNGRDWAQLATLQAGVTGVQTGSAI